VLNVDGKNKNIKTASFDIMRHYVANCAWLRHCGQALTFAICDLHHPRIATGHGRATFGMVVRNGTQ